MRRAMRNARLATWTQQTCPLHLCSGNYCRHCNWSSGRVLSLLVRAQLSGCVNRVSSLSTTMTGKNRARTRHRVRRGSTIQLLTRFKEKLDALKGNTGSRKDTPQGFDSKTCFDEATRFFGSDVVNYLAIEGTEFDEKRLDILPCDKQWRVHIAQGLGSIPWDYAWADFLEQLIFVSRLRGLPSGISHSSNRVWLITCPLSNCSAQS